MNSKIEISANAGAVAVVAIVTAGVVGCFLGSRKTSLEKYKYNKAREERMEEIRRDLEKKVVDMRGREIAREYQRSKKQTETEE